MNSITAFWQLLYYLEHLTVPCTTVNNNGVIYGGSCVQAFLMTLYVHGSWFLVGLS